MILELHPLAQKYPPMEADEFAAFKADLAEHGQKNPIWLFEGKVLDGRNRLRACTELGLEPVFAEFAGNEPEAAAFVDSQNLHRRHLNKEWRKKRVMELRAKGLSTHVIAKEVGCHHRTVQRDLVSVGAYAPTETTTSAGKAERNDADSVGAYAPTEIPNSEPIPVAESATTELSMQPTPKPPIEPPRVKGRDGKSYRAQKPAAKPRATAPPAKAPQPTATKAKPAPQAKAQWIELASILGELAQKVETLVPTPEENERPWELISSLEKTARSLLRQADRLRRRHHL